MPLLNDVARCQGHKINTDTETLCAFRYSCARYVERHTGGPRTMTYAYLCIGGDDNYIPVEKDGKTTENR